MTTTAEKYNASSGLVKPNSENEKQGTTGNTLRQVLVNGRTFQIQSDRRSTFLGSKLLGHGLHIFENGNVQIQAGPKKDGNGKFNVVSRGGQIIKTGPTVVERRGFKKSFLQKDYPDEVIAAEETNYGDVVQRTHGTLRIKATNIILEADDTMAIEVGDTLTLAAKGSIFQNTGRYTSIFNVKDERGSRAKIKVLQRLMEGNDPRGSDDIVIAGHVNRRFGGDYSAEIGGISGHYIMGNKALPGVPLVLNRTFGLHIGLTAPSAGFGGVNIESKTGAMNLLAGANMTMNAGALFNLTTVGFTNINSGGDINMSSAKAVGIAAGGLSVPTGSIGDVNIRADKDVKITASKGAIDMDATFIYLN
tara:strand:+ start:6889 stop:7974 length:1086 start_codon:yes stop_codon:yes gene_type:complete